MTAVVSVVLPCHNRSTELLQALQSLCDQTLPPGRFEVIVIDQASQDGSSEVASRFEGDLDLRLIEQEAALGPAAARNAGIAAAQAELVLLLDCDMVADSELLASHLACQAARPGSLVCGRVLPYPPAYRSFIDRAANPEAGLDRGEGRGDLPFYQAISGNLSAETACLRQLGLFDVSLRAFEDVDLGYRAHRAGIRIVNCGSALSYHNHARSLDERLAQAHAYNRVWPVLLRRYPELRGKVPGLRDYEPINWRADRGERLRGKLGARLYGSGPARLVLREVLGLLDRAEALPRVAKVLYWRLMVGTWYAGVRDGTRG
jgi:GT2 family glycosyltransferase